MKKYLLAALVVLSASTFAANVTVFGGVNVNGGIQFADYSEMDTKMGYTVGVEAHKSVAKFTNGNFEVGLGTKYDSTIINDETSEAYEYASSMPVYGSLKYSYKVNKKVNVYVQGKAGYVFMFDGKVIDEANDGIKEVETLIGYDIDAEYGIKGKVYTGVAVGAEMGNYTLGLSYDITKADLEITGSEAADWADFAGENVKTEAEYSKLALTVGYKFGK